MHAHAHEHTHTHACTHARTHARTHTHTHMHARTHMHICTYVSVCGCEAHIKCVYRCYAHQHTIFIHMHVHIYVLKQFILLFIVLTKVYSDSNVVVNITIASSSDTAFVSTKLINYY